MTMSKIVTAVVIALSILGAVANIANAANGEEFGTKTSPLQQPSPN